MNRFSTPVSLHLFNRPEKTRELVGILRRVEPATLFITCDGPDEKNKSLVEETKRVIEEEVDWGCDIYKNYGSENKGSYKNNSEALSWVFGKVESAIILEDDCMPNLSFFRFCSELLEKYKNDERVALVSGNNFSEKSAIHNSYSFSRYAFIWGWATWARVWNSLDLEMHEWPEYEKNNGLKSRFHEWYPRMHWKKKFSRMHELNMKNNGQVGQHWDRKLNMHINMNSQFAIVPECNLVSNVGYGASAANCKSRTKFHNLETKEISFPLSHPSYVYPDVGLDEVHEKLRFSGGLYGAPKKIGKKIQSKITRITKSG